MTEHDRNGQLAANTHLTTENHAKNVAGAIRVRGKSAKNKAKSQKQTQANPEPLSASSSQDVKEANAAISLISVLEALAAMSPKAKIASTATDTPTSQTTQKLASRSASSSPEPFDDDFILGTGGSGTTVGTPNDDDMLSAEEDEERWCDDGSDNSVTPPSGRAADALPSVKQSNEEIQVQVEYWGKTLADAPVLLDLPTDHPRPPQQSFAGSRLPIQFGTSLTEPLRKLAKEYKVDSSTIMLAAWSIFLSRLSGQEDIVIGINNTVSNQVGHEEHHDKTFPLRIDLSGNPSGTQLLERVRQATVTAEAYQGLSLAKIIEVATPTINKSFAPLFQAAFHWPKQKWQPSSLEATQAPSDPIRVHVDLELHLHGIGKEIVGELRFAKALFNVDSIKRYVGYLKAILSSFTKDAAGPVATIDILSSSEKSLLLDSWNETSATYPDHLCIHQLFEHQVGLTPQATALVYGDKELSYSNLDTKANQLAHLLIELGVRPDTPVAICVDRSPAMVISVLAVLKAGGAYVPLDPSYPVERLSGILDDAMPALLLADMTGRITLEGAGLTHLVIIDPNDQLSSPSTRPQVSGLTSRHLAYIIYTSGSTGKPKGVMVEHRGVTSLISSRPAYYGVSPSSRVLQFTSLSFDVSVSELFMALCSGASLYLLEDHFRLDQRELWGFLARHSITHVTATPSLLQNCTSLTPMTTPVTFITGGEVLSAALLRELKTLVPEGSVFSEYGPTEATIAATAFKCTLDSNGDVMPIGRPLSNKRIYILDQYRQPVPLGAVGEIYIGGVGVARGYLNKPGLTAQVFVDDPFSEDAKAQMYKTGDLARYLPDGNIFFIGRVDHQVKIRGFRIELGEIEARLADYPLVQAAVVVALGEGSNKRLVAYVVAEPDDQLINTLRSYLASSLPDHMVPAAFVRLDVLPLSPNGKVDRRALPAPGADAFASSAYEPPQGETETILAHIWTELLHLDRVSRSDNFFALGGHSLQVVGMLERLRRRGLTASVSAVYSSPVLSDLAQATGKHVEAVIPSNLITLQTTKLSPELLPLINLTQNDIDQIIDQTPDGLENIQDIYALSPLQDGILFHHLLATEGDPYLRSTQMAFESRDLLDRYLQAFQTVVNRHDILRTAFAWKSISTPAQVVWRQAPLHIREVWLDPASGPTLEQLNKRFHPSHYRIDLTQAPLSQFIIAQEINGRWLLLQLMHHLIGDHTAAEMMNQEIERILQGQEHTLSAPQPFRNLVALAHKGLDQDSHEQFFKEMLADIEEPAFPFGMSEVDHNGAEIVESHQILPQDLNDRLRLQAKQLGVGLASLCHVALAQVIARASGQDRVVFGTVVAGGTQADDQDNRVMGFAINTLPFRCDVESDSVRESVKKAHKRLAELLDHEHASLSVAQRCSGVASGTPLFSVLLNFLHSAISQKGNSKSSEMEFVSEEEQVHYKGIELIGGQERTNYPFTVTVEDFGTAIGLTALIIQPIDPVRVGGYIRQALESLVDALERTPDNLTCELDVLPQEERELLLRTWNPVAADFPRHQTIHGMLEDQVKRTPDAIAVVYDGQEITYSDLNTRANRLSHRLIELGVKPDTLVAICVERSPTMVIAASAVLKAGGAYVPLDPTYPRDRLVGILEDAKPAILLADTIGHDTLWGAGVQPGEQRGKVADGHM
ncbi:hypothetical protein BGZ65_000977 [Modicella reniformis]|uniref:Carrier domain-containing protein n=1 Tax=Modicella reniformis TaxID=1440133 RepID=A0A9P6J4D6_9FUNG|nr:hypothetical protein BGZ65_000977 [Modicella reniformis]